MIGRLQGRIGYKASDHLLLDVNGVGYLVYCAERTLMSLPGPGEPVSLYTDLLVREDLLQLFGFSSLAEKEWYRLLLTVQGVGSKASLAILGILGPEGVGRAIALGDSAAVRAAPGVGPKLALRVINELKDKAPALMAAAVPVEALAPQPSEVVEAGPAISPSPAPAASPAVAAPSHDAEALSALANLGYSPSDAARAVAEAGQATPEASTADLIRAALRLLAPKV
ncbi:MAG: Holliday junction branch migration protein RuvA [Mangrovicoccus sp.]